MENENIDVNKISFRKVAFITLVIIVAIFIIYYTVMSIIGPSRKFASLQDEFGLRQANEGSVDERILTDSLYLVLLNEKAFLQSRIVMADADSIYLTIGLTDSIVNIEISGVVVHSTKMSEINVSKIIAKGNENIILSLFASPFSISNDYATIKKEPVMIKMAPKDTSEYKPDIVPDTSLTEPVSIIFEMTNGFRIYICQEEGENLNDRIELLWFEIKYRLDDTWSAIKSVFHFKVPDYNPFIRIKIPRADAKIIYRAIPKYGQVGIYK